MFKGIGINTKKISFQSFQLLYFSIGTNRTGLCLIVAGRCSYAYKNSANFPDTWYNGPHTRDGRLSGVSALVWNYVLYIISLSRYQLCRNGTWWRKQPEWCQNYETNRQSIGTDWKSNTANQIERIIHNLKTIGNVAHFSRDCRRRDQSKGWNETVF